MDEDILNSQLVRVGIVATTSSDDLLDDVGFSAWQRSGGAALEQALPPHQFNLLRMLTLPRGRRDELSRTLRDWCDAPNPNYRCHLILTLGGDGFAPSDIVPEATRDVIEREAPGLADLLRRAAEDTAGDPSDVPAIRRAAALCRGVAGLRGGTLIVNVPGCYDDPMAALDALLPILPAVLEQIDPVEEP